MSVTPAQLHGSWRLVRAARTTDNQVTDEQPLGVDPQGRLHYLHDGGMVVVIAHGGRRPLSGGRYTSPDDETAAAARTFDAYAGTFACAGDRVVHRVQLSSYENDRGAEYVRTVRFCGDLLTLGTPAQRTPTGVVVTWLLWARAAK